MSNENILRSYLSSIGFQVDEDAYRKFKATLADSSKRTAELSQKLEELAVVAAGVATELSASVMKIATSMDRLYFTSQRTGASSKNIQALQFGAEKIGVSAEEATAALENMSQALRTNPAMIGLLRAMNINPNQDKVELMLQLIEKLSKLPYPIAHQYAQMLGIDERTFYQMETHLKELREAMEQNKKTNPIDDKTVKEFHDFMNQVRDLTGHLEQLANVAGATLLPVAKQVVYWLDQGVQVLLLADKATNHWSTGLLTLAGSVGSVIGGLKMLKTVMGVLGLGGAGEAAAGAGTAAGAGGIGAMLLKSGPLAAGVLGGLLAKWGIDIKADTYKIKSDTDYQSALAGNKMAQAFQAQYEKETGHKASDNYLNYATWLNETGRIGTAGGGIKNMPKPMANNDVANTRAMIIQTAKELGIDPALALAQAHQESNFNQNARSKVGAIGVMQLMPETAKQLGVDPNDKAQNIRGGLIYLKQLLMEFHAEELALAAYDSGPGRVARVGRIPNIKETQDYVARIEGYKLGEQRALGMGGSDAAPPVTIHQTTEINVDGATDPRETANRVAQQQREVNSDLIRNMTPTVR